MQRSDLSVFSSAIGERVISLPISIHLRIEFEIGAAYFDISVGISWMPYAHRTCSSASVEIPNDEMPRSVSVRQPRDGCALGRQHDAPLACICGNHLSRCTRYSIERYGLGGGEVASRASSSDRSRGRKRLASPLPR